MAWLYSLLALQVIGLGAVAACLRRLQTLERRTEIQFEFVESPG